MAINEDLDAAVAQLKQTTSSGTQMIKKYGADESKWPANSHWGKALASIDSARTLEPPPPPPPPPTPSGSTYDQLVAALVNPAVIARTTPNVVLTKPNATDLNNALAKVVPGDWLYIKGGVIAGQINIPRKNLGAYARIVFDTTTKFTGKPDTSGGASPCIYIGGSTDPNNACAYWDFVFEPGCDITNPAGGAILVHGNTHHVCLDGWYAHDMGADGCSMFPPEGEIHHMFSRGEAKNIGLEWRFDPHADKGSGLHGMNVQDNENYSFHDSTIAIYGHDFSHSGGSILECGINVGGPVAAQPHNNHYYVKGLRNHYKSTTQTGGNGINMWGGAQHDNTFHIIEVEDMYGHAYMAGAQREPLTNVVVLKGTAKNTMQNPHETGNTWDSKGGTIFKDVSGS